MRVEGLGKDFRHPWTQRIKTAVHEVSFDVPEGGVFGLLGPNGAGKTTTLRMLLGLLPATRGQAWLLGRPAGTPESREDVGFLPENPYFYDHLTALEFLEFSGELAGHVAARPRARRRATWSRRVGLGARGAHAPAQVLEGHAPARRASRTRSWDGRACCSSTSRCPGSTRSAAARSST